MSTNTQTKPVVALDLTKDVPRSPNALLGPYVLLARNIDKTRAAIAGTAGEFHWNCPLAQIFFKFKGIDPQAFYDELAAGKTDDEILAWVEEVGTPKTDEEVLEWAYDSRWYSPEEASKKAYVEQTLREAAGDRPIPYIQSYFQMLDFEEGRL